VRRHANFSASYLFSLAQSASDYGWPKFALKGKIVLFLKRFELGQKLGF